MSKAPLTSRGWDGDYILTYYSTKEHFPIGEKVASVNGNEYTVVGGAAPHKKSSTGRVYVRYGTFDATYFPGVVGAKWRRVVS